MKRYPRVRVVLTHGLAWRMFMADNELVVPDEVFDAVPIDNPNLSLQVMFPIALGKEWDYPMPQVLPTIERLVSLMGAERIIWGTDIPMVMRHFTYRQTLDQVRLYWGFLSEGEKELVLGGNMAWLLGHR